MEFNQLEVAAYTGEYLDYDDMEPVEYKYFIRIQQLGINNRSGKIANPNEIATLRNQYYDQYQRERKIQDELEAYNAAWVACVKITESLRVHINGETDSLKIAALACRGIYVMTGDVMIQKKMKELEEQIK